jgi:photosystem II stability/assembly factor-like uncharacterized protein
MNENRDNGSGDFPDQDAALQAGLRSDLQRSIVPPPIPVHVREAVELMAVNRGRETGARRLAWRGASALASLAAAAAIVAIIGVSLSLRGPGPAAPTARPTPGTPGPVLPDPTDGQTPATSFQWTGAGLTAFASTGDGRIRFTEDGGVTWSAPVSVPAASDSKAAESLDFVDRLHGWQDATVLESGVWHIKIERTTDGGLTWKLSEAAAFAEGDQLGLYAATHFTDAYHGVALVARPLESASATPGPATTFQSCVEYVTVDGGATWTGPKTSACLGLGGVNWFNRSVGVMRGDSSALISTTLDGGATWRTATLPGIAPSEGPWSLIPSVDDRSVIHLLTMVIPLDGSWTEAPLVTYVSQDGGSTWVEESRSTMPAGGGLGNWTSILGPDYYLTLHQVGTWLPVQDDFLRSTDGGRTWTEVATSGFSDATYMDWADEIHGILLGIKDCPAGQTCPYVGTHSSGVFLTDDGGKTWHQLAFPVPAGGPGPSSAASAGPS